ncbi:leucyl aminopeptidase [Candidatus Pelagibacter sp.]|nr:leucyl aminopeptidase [Candidatus Pelagibacter sp.]
MTALINYYQLKQLKNQRCFILFYDKKNTIKLEDNSLLKNQIKIINENIKLALKQNEEISEISLSSELKIILVLFEYKKEDIFKEKIGGRIFDYLKDKSIRDYYLLEQNLKYLIKIESDILDHILHGFNLKSYKFEKYKTKNKAKTITIHIPIKFKAKLNNRNPRLKSILDGVQLTKDLVSEPGNILHPDEYVNRIKKLTSLGLKVTILDKKKLKQLGMNALLGVGQGSIRGSYLVIIEWNGSSKKHQPLAFVGKGVCFDTGGISLKPAKFMEDMTYDMAGSAVVVGLMKTLALRKAKVNAVGVVGLVENMPDGNAQRPGDIVKSYSGKTIEILNTDAEGRLVLADALTYTEKKFKPKFILDLATLTGAIIVSLGSEHAGLFSNNDKISDQLSKAGKKVDEKVWRMPLNDNYDKLINSKKADMQNINYVGGAGSITAAQFLQRFILNKTPWAHLDIAGMAFSKYGGALNSEGATGYGVRLLNQLIEDNYE